MTKAAIGSVLAGILIAGGGAALAGKSSSEGAGGAAIPKEVKDMECLVGAWKGAARMTLGADRADVKLAWTCKRTPGDWGVQCALRMTGVPGMASYEENDLFGFDPGGGKYHWFSVTNAGETHDHVADVPKGDDVRWVYSGVQEGKPFREVIDMRFSEAGKALTIRGETFLDGKSTSVLEGTLRK